MWINIRSDYIVGFERSDATFCPFLWDISTDVLLQTKEENFGCVENHKKDFRDHSLLRFLDDASMGTWLAFSEQEKVLLESKHF